MQKAEAEEILRARVAAGGKLVVVQQGDLRTIKLLRDRCHEAGVAALLRPASGTG